MHTEATKLIHATQAALGGLVQSYNSCEVMMSEVLRLAAGGGETNRILIAHMSREAVCDALRALAEGEILEVGLRSPILHGVEFFRRLYPYRDYFVHESHPSFGIDTENGKAHMTARGAQRRKGGRVRFSSVTTPQLTAARDTCKALTTHLSNVLSLIIFTRRPPDMEVCGFDPFWTHPPLPARFQHPGDSPAE